MVKRENYMEYTTGNFKRISEDLSFLINSCAATAKIKQIVVEEEEENFLLRSSMHLLLLAPIGQIKSTILSQIAGQTKREVITEITRAGLVGSLDSKTIQIIPGTAWECRNSLMILDEFSFGRKKEGWEVFLQLLESQSWGKRIGMFSADQRIEDEDLYFNVGKGRIDLKTRFSCIVATMKNFEFQRGQNFRAFVSRCVPFTFNLKEEDLDKIAEGKKLYKVYKYSPEPVVYIKNSKYKQIKRTVWKELKKCSLEYVRKELFLRSLGDCCRIYAATGKNDSDIFEKVTSWKVSAQMLIGKYYKTARIGKHAHNKM